MASVNANVSFSSVSFPAGTPEVALIRMQLMQGTYAAQTHDVPVANPLSFTFNSVAPETYTVKVTALAENTGPIGTPVQSSSFTVADDVTRIVPVAVSVSI